MYKYLILILTVISIISCNSNTNSNNSTIKKETKKEIKKETKKETKKEIKKYDNKNPLKMEIKYPKTTQNGILIHPEVILNNNGEFPIVLLSINIQIPRTSNSYTGTTALKAFKHKFKAGKSFMREYVEVPDSKHYMYTVPEVHKIKDVIYSNTQKKIKLDLVPQLLKDEIYKANISISYVVLNDFWNNKVYTLVGTNKKDGLIRELYSASKKPLKLEGKLLPSAELGRAINKKIEISMKLTGWLPKIKNVNQISEFAYIKSLDSWIYAGTLETTIQDKKGKLITFKGINAARTIMKSILKGKLKVYLHKKFYKDTQKILSPYIEGIIEKENDFYHVVIPSEKVPEVLLELKKINYGIHKGHSVSKLH